MSSDSTQNFHIYPVTEQDLPAWLALRETLWPEVTLEEHEAQMASILESRFQKAAFVCRVADGDDIIGLVEVSIRQAANGCRTSPVGYLEGLYVCAEWRRRHVAAELVTMAERWARGRGCREMASDTAIDNVLGQSFHERVGYKEHARLVVFTKTLAAPAADATASVQATEVRRSANGVGVARVGMTLLHLLAAVAGLIAFYYVDLWSGDIVRGGVMPCIASLSVIYFLVVLAAARYRKRTNESERLSELFTSPHSSSGTPDTDEIRSRPDAALERKL